MKTTEFCIALVILGAMTKLNIMCGRQFMNTMAESVKPAIEKQIALQGLADEYLIQDKIIINKVTGTLFRFKGLDRNIKSIKGWEDVDIFWGEEADTITHRAWELLTKTIRKPGSQIWLSLNRGNRADAVDKRFFSEGADLANCIVQKVGWQDNPHLSAEQHAERLHDLKFNPERYSHIWEGEPDDSASAYKVLPYEKLLKCVDAHIKLKYSPSGMGQAGLDVGDVGDPSAWAFRKGSLLSIVKEWKVKYLHMTAAKADFLNKKNNVMFMHYDVGGMGAGTKSDLSRIQKNPETGQGPDIRKFIPFHFGGKVKGGKKYYIKHSKLKIKNKDYFSKANAQAWWNIRLRVDNTIKALEGQRVDLGRCFFIDGSIEDLDKILSELNQCVYDDSSGKIKVDKAPDNSVSPNLADAIILAYVNDIKKGLKSA